MGRVIYSPSPFSPATRLNSVMFVVATAVPHSLTPERADTSPSSWLETTKRESVCTDWNLTKSSCGAHAPSGVGRAEGGGAAAGSAHRQPRAKLLRRQLELLLRLPPLGVVEIERGAIHKELDFLRQRDAGVRRELD